MLGEGVKCLIHIGYRLLQELQRRKSFFSFPSCPSLFSFAPLENKEKCIFFVNVSFSIRVEWNRGRPSSYRFTIKRTGPRTGIISVPFPLYFLFFHFSVRPKLFHGISIVDCFLRSLSLISYCLNSKRRKRVLRKNKLYGCWGRHRTPRERQACLL